MSEWTKCEVCGRPEIDFCSCKKENKPIDKCKTCPEQIDRSEHDCDYCEDCCHDLQMSWQVAE